MRAATLPGLLFAAAACAATIEVTPDATTITAPDLEDCEGVEMLLTVRQGTAPTRSIRTLVQGGMLEFSSDELKDYDFGSTFTFELRVLPHQSEGCPFPSWALWFANNKRLNSAGARKYTISASEFERQ